MERMQIRVFPHMIICSLYFMAGVVIVTINILDEEDKTLCTV